MGMGYGPRVMQHDEAFLAKGRLIIAGAGNLGRELFGWLEPELTTCCVFIADGEDPEVATPIDEFAAQPEDRFIVAIADCTARELITQRLHAKGIAPVTWVHSTHVTAGARIGAGSMLMPFSLTSTNVKMGRGTLLNCYASCGHDVTLGSFCTVSAHVDLCGHVTVGDRVFFGSGARVIPGVTIGNDARIGAGAVVMRNVAPGVTVYGHTAKAL